MADPTRFYGRADSDWERLRQCLAFDPAATLDRVTALYLLQEYADFRNAVTLLAWNRASRRQGFKDLAARQEPGYRRWVNERMRSVHD